MTSPPNYSNKYRLVHIHVTFKELGMANGGWYGTQEEWDQIEKPLLEVDPILEQFAKENGLTVTRNLKDWPERSMVWGNDVRCLIQLYLVDEELLTFNLWLCASQDRGSKRYWKHETPIKETQTAEFKDTFFAQLVEGHQKLLRWSKNHNELTPT